MAETKNSHKREPELCFVGRACVVSCPARPALARLKACGLRPAHTSREALANVAKLCVRLRSAGQSNAQMPGDRCLPLGAESRVSSRRASEKQKHIKGKYKAVRPAWGFQFSVCPNAAESKNSKSNRIARKFTMSCNSLLFRQNTPSHDGPAPESQETTRQRRAHSTPSRDEPRAKVARCIAPASCDAERRSSDAAPSEFNR